MTNFHCQDQDITLELLVEANDHELSQIVPKIKDKIKIRSALDKLQVSSDAKESVSVSLPFRQNATIDFLSDEANGTQSQEWTIPLDSSDLEILNDFKTFQETERGKSLRQVLSSISAGKVLLAKAEKRERLSSVDRALLVKIIVEVEINALDEHKQSIRKDVWQRWSKEVSRSFHMRKFRSLLCALSYHRFFFELYFVK
ncbi:hypothetical protein ACJJTC_008089 [Scirpophaga incertulas]